MANESGMYAGTVVETFSLFGVTGLYVGQVLFRYTLGGRLCPEAFTSTKTIIPQVLLGLVCALLYNAPYKIGSKLMGESVPLWAQAVFIEAIPRFLVGIIITYALPKLLSRLTSYPCTLREDTASAYEEDDCEKQANTATKTQQIKGKFARYCSLTSSF